MTKITNPPRFIIDKDNARLTLIDNEGVDDYYFLDDPEDVEKLVDLVNSIINPKCTVRLCLHCKYCFRDDNYGVCCVNKKSVHQTNYWDLPVESINECEYFEQEW